MNPEAWNAVDELAAAHAALDAIEIALFGDNWRRSRDELVERAEYLRRLAANAESDEMCPCGTPDECIPGSPGCVIDNARTEEQE